VLDSVNKWPEFAAQAGVTKERIARIANCHIHFFADS